MHIYIYIFIYTYTYTYTYVYIYIYIHDRWYFVDRWNVFDFIVVLLSILTVVLDAYNSEWFCGRLVYVGFVYVLMYNLYMHIYAAGM